MPWYMIALASIVSYFSIGHMLYGIFSGWQKAVAKDNGRYYSLNDYTCWEPWCIIIFWPLWSIGRICLFLFGYDSLPSFSSRLGTAIYQVATVPKKRRLKKQKEKEDQELAEANIEYEIQQQIDAKAKAIKC